MLAIGSRGILISREIDPTTNQFVWTTALDSHGLSTQVVNAIEINGSQIKGDIISSYEGNTWINLNDGTFNFGDKIKYDGTNFTISSSSGGDINNEFEEWKEQYEKDKAETDKELADINNALENIGSTIDDSFKDGIIDEVEMLDIKTALKNLEKEKLDIDARYENIYNNVSLIGSAKTNLKTQYDNFVTKYNNLVSIINTIISDGLATDEEVIQYETAFNSYNQSVPSLSTAFDVAIETIAKNNAETQIDELKNALDTDIQNANDSIANLEETMNGSFKDGLIDEAEYIAIKESLTRLETEKSDIDKNYQSLYNNANISNSAKTELKTKYDNYNTVHDFLVNYINITIGDRIATQVEIAVIRAKLTEYNTALAEYSVAQTNAINDIAENSANTNLQNYKKLVDQDISDINQKINDMTIDIEGVIADGIIDEAETLIIQNNITELNKEKADIDERYNNIYNNANLNNTTEKTNLANKYNSYNTAHNNLINTINTIIEDKVITTSEKSDFDTVVNNYNIALSQLSIAFDNAISKISENMANSIMESLRTELQGNIDDVSNLVSDLNDYVDGAFKDGVLTESEKDSIRTYLVSLNTEKTDIDQQYTSLYNNADLSGTAKTNLKTAYDTYVTKYNNLVSKINAILELDAISDSSRTSLNTAFSEHDTALATYSQKVNEAIDSIAEKKKEDAKSYTDTQFNILDGKIELRVTNEQVEEYIENIEIGGRNLAQNTSSEYCDALDNFTGITNETRTVGKVLTDGLSVGDTVCVRLFYKYDNITSASGQTAVAYIQGSGDVTAWNSGAFVASPQKTLSGSGEHEFKYSFTVTSNHIKNSYWNIQIRHNYVASGTVQWKKFKVERGTKYTDWTPAPEDAVNQMEALKDMADDLQNQVDGKIETYYQTTDPSTSWTTTDLKTQHTGDIWHDSLNNITYRWSGTTWVKLTDSDAEQAYALASTKAKVFTSQPTTPYKVGDLWVQGSGGDIMECTYTRASGSYVSTDWAKASKYTDDTTANSVKNDLANNYYTKTQTDSAITVAKETIELSVSKAIETVQGDIDDVESNLANNYYTKTQTDSAIKVSADSINSSVSSTYVTKDTFNNTTSTLATKSELNQTSTEITASFTEMHNGGYSQGVTTINKDGVTVTNGALTVKDNNGNKVLYGDSSGNLYLIGYIQGVDQQIKLVGDERKIDGRNDALRFQYDSENYMYIDSDSRCIFYSTNATGRTTTGYNAPRIQVDSNGHSRFYGGCGMIKILNNYAYPDVQARSSSDGSYARMCASSFEVNSKKEFKENIKNVDANTIINVLKNNCVKSYNLISEREALDLLEKEAQEKGIELEYEMITPDEKLGLVIEDLTDDAKDLLFASNSDGIDLYNMASMLWSICQEQQKTIEKQEQKILSLEERLDKLEEILGGENK